MEDIAIIGLGLRFPGDATSPEELWKVLCHKECQWSEFPKDRLNIDGYYHPSGKRQGGISFRGGHFLKEDIKAFDASFFAIPTEEANAIDPQQRMLLEVSYEALENAGIRKDDIDGSDTAVYVGSFVKDYEQICLRDPDWSPQYAATGNGIAIMANRISYFFNLHGPSMTIDTGCSGSLIAVHLAAQSLRTGETSLALAAGAGMILTPNTIMPMTALNFLSPDGKCFTFDSRANGYGRGEGIGVVVMKRLCDALRDNDTIQAVIRASGTNQDGRTPGITLPSTMAQVANIRSVYASAGLDFNQTAYVECHGTGTQAGDYRELKAIAETLGSVRSVNNPIVVGSVKPNIGHLEGAAGIAGLIKVILTLKKGQIPPNVNFEKGNPTIDFQSWKVKVPTEMLDWPIPGLRRVSVNCFGFGGSNAHVVMDEAHGYLSSRGLKGNCASTDQPQDFNDLLNASNGSFNTIPTLLCYSAHDKQGVGRVVDSHIATLQQGQMTLSEEFLRNYAYTLSNRRSNLEWKGFVIADSPTTLGTKLKEFNVGSVMRSPLGKSPKICFIFSGQGAQWAQMGKDLMPFRVFASSITEASSFLQIALASPFDLVEEMLREAKESRISDPEISQPATTALQIALVDLLRSFGIQPNHVIGHSSGEIAAAYAAGAVSRHDAWRAAYYRGLAAASVPVRAPKLIGGMMVVGLSLEDTTKYLLQVGKPVQIACINSPQSVTISGQLESIKLISKDLREKSIFSKVLDVNVAYHSSHMKLVECDYMDCLEDIVPNMCHESVKMFSTVTGERVTGSELDGKYWARNLVSPVQYLAAIQSLTKQPIEERPDLIIELSPAAALRSPTTDILANLENGDGLEYFSVLTRRESGPSTLLKLVGELWVRGNPIDMKSVVSRGKRNVPLKSISDLPSYPWNHSKQYWHESHLSLTNRFREYPRQDLLGARTADSTPFEPRWRGFLRIPENPWIQEHQIQKTIIYPAAGMITMILEGACQLAANDKDDIFGYEITNIVIEKAMLIPHNDHGLEVALNMKADPSTTNLSSKPRLYEFSIYSKPLDRPWERNATGSVTFHYKSGDWTTSFQAHDVHFKKLNDSCQESIIPRQLYEHLDAVGMNYGSSFQNIVEVRREGNSCVSKVKIPNTKSKMPCQFEYPHLLHPTVLDSIFQTLLAIKPLPMAPVYIRTLFVSANLSSGLSGGEFQGYSRTNLSGIRDAEATIFMQQSGTDYGYVVIDGFHLTGLSSPSSQEGAFLPNHHNLVSQIVWKEDADFASPTSFDEQVTLIAHKYPSLSVLQIGESAQLTSATLRILASMQGEVPRISRYTILGANYDGEFSEDFAPIQDSRLGHFVEKIHDVASIHSNYHLIIVYDEDLANTDLLKQSLRPGGIVLKQRKAAEPASLWLTQTIADKGTVVVDDRTANSMIPRQDGSSQTPKISFIGENLEILFDVDRINLAAHANGNIIILLPEKCQDDVPIFVKSVEQRKQANKHSFNISCMGIAEITDDTSILAGSLVISLLDFSASQSADSSVFHWDREAFKAFHTLQRYAKAILWVTRGAHMTCKNPKGSPIIAIARTLMSEDPFKVIVTFDLGFESRLSDETIVDNLVTIMNVTLNRQPTSDPRETEFAEEDGRIYIPRLTTLPDLNRIIEKDGICGEFKPEVFSSLGSRLQLEIANPGIDNAGLYFRKVTPRNLGPDEVKIAFEEAFLTYLDLETVLGRTDESFIGIDVRGHVMEIGHQVSHVAPGDKVVALVSGGGFQNILHVQSSFVKRSDSFVIPSILVSAYYALFHVGRVKAGSRVLIHAGASAFGLLAVDLAIAVGAEVFATLVGQKIDQQRDVLKEHGLPETHIFDAESGGIVSTLRAATKLQGVDLLYNPTQEQFDTDFKCVRNCGTIVQLANTSPTPCSRRLPPTPITIVNLHIHQLLKEDPGFVAELFDLAMEFVEEIRIKTAPSSELTTFDLAELEDSLKHIQEVLYLGYTSITSNPEGHSLVSVLNERITKPLREHIDIHGTYVLAGGLGGLGRSIAELLVNNGARHLAFISRSGASSEAARSFIGYLRNRGIHVQAYSVDICDADSLGTIINDTMTCEMPPVRGVFQCAAIVRDAVFENMTFEDWNTAIKPKTVGTWNLFQAMTAAGHDPFYVFLASSAGIIGSRGQANYAAGNCFEDSMARYLRQSGKHAVAIDLGPVLGAGMLVEDEEILDILRASGFYGIRHEDFLKVIEHAITGEIVPGTPIPAQVSLGVGTGGLIRQNQPTDPYWSRTALYSYLNLVDMPPPSPTAAADQESQDIKTMLLSAPDIESVTTIVLAGLSQMLSKAMNMLPEEIDVSRPPNAYGVDSLVAVGVRSWVLNNCGVQISVFEVLNDSSIAELSRIIAGRGGYGSRRKG